MMADKKVDQRVPDTGDATSRLVKLLVRDVGLSNFKSSDNGATDIRRLVCMAYNSAAEARDLWEMAREFARLVDETPDVPESFKTAICSGILRAHSNKELGAKN